MKPDLHESFVKFENFGKDYGSENAANGVWKKVGDGIIEDADVAMDPVSLDNAKLTDLAPQVQTKPIPQVQTKSLRETENKYSRLQIYEIISERNAFCSKATELGMVESFKHYSPADRSLVRKFLVRLGQSLRSLLRRSRTNKESDDDTELVEMEVKAGYEQFVVAGIEEIFEDIVPDEP